MKLVDLDPWFVGSGGEGVTKNGQPVARREGVGLAFTCPCGCGQGRFVPFTNPLDGGPNEHPKGWQREGTTFEALTLRPSILVVGQCGWHGFITNGEVTTV